MLSRLVPIIKICKNDFSEKKCKNHHNCQICTFGKIEFFPYLKLPNAF